jgi:acetyl-CoA carboxylase carboxyltransferase component
MDSKSIGADIVLAWPTNEVAVMGAEGAANIIFRREIAAAGGRSSAVDEFVQQYRDDMMNPLVAAEQGFVDAIIDPADTRRVLVQTLRMLNNKKEDLPKRKHANMPL